MGIRKCQKWGSITGKFPAIFNYGSPPPPPRVIYLRARLRLINVLLPCNITTPLSSHSTLSNNGFTTSGMSGCKTSTNQVSQMNITFTASCSQHNQFDARSLKLLSQQNIISVSSLLCLSTLVQSKQVATYSESRHLRSI